MTTPEVGGMADPPATDVTRAARHQLVAIRVPAAPRNVPELRRLLTSFAAVHGADGEARKNIALAVSEAVTNAVVHGSGRDATRSVDVVADYEDGAIEVVVADEGPGLGADDDYDAVAALPSVEPRIGGDGDWASDAADRS